MMKKRLSKKIWYGSDIDSEGKPVLPPLAKDSEDLEGLHYGELYLHIADDKLSLWTRTLTDQIKQIGGEGSGGDLWKLMETESGEKYIFSAFDVATQKGITSYANGGMLNLPSIYDGLVIDNQTIYWDVVKEEVGTDEEGNPIYKITKVLKAKGGDGNGNGGSTTASLTIKYDGAGNAITDLEYEDGVLIATRKYSFAAASGLQAINQRVTDIEETLASGGGSTGSVDLSKYATKDYVIGAITSNITGLATEQFVLEQIAGLEGGGTIDLSSYAEKTWVNENFASNDWVSSNFASLEGNNTFSGTNKFDGSLFVNNKEIKYNSKGYWELEGDLLVTGGITSFASSSGFTPSTVMDGVVVDGKTIIKQDGKLVVVGGGSSDGGGSGDFPDLSAYAEKTWVDSKFATLSQFATLSATVSNKANTSNVYTKSEVDTKVNEKWTTDSQKISNWDAAFSWGNHADEGYVKSDSLTETLKSYVTVGGTEMQTITGKKNFTGGLFVNGQELVYNDDGYWKMEGNLLVTGGITSYSSDGKATPFLIYADTWEGITSDSATQVYSAASVTLLKNEVKSVGDDADSALAKLAIIKEELLTLTENSLTTAIRTALLNIKERI